MKGRDVMEKYSIPSSTKGLIGIWRYDNDQVVGEAISIDEGKIESGVAYYDKPYPSEYKNVEHGNVIYDVMTQSYSLWCSKEIAGNQQVVKRLLEFFGLLNCRCDIERISERV